MEGFGFAIQIYNEFTCVHGVQYTIYSTLE